MVRGLSALKCSVFCVQELLQEEEKTARHLEQELAAARAEALEDPDGAAQKNGPSAVHDDAEDADSGADRVDAPMTVAQVSSVRTKVQPRRTCSERTTLIQ